jgi:hypothetical protein
MAQAKVRDKCLVRLYRTEGILVAELFYNARPGEFISKQIVRYVEGAIAILKNVREIISRDSNSQYPNLQ